MCHVTIDSLNVCLVDANMFRSESRITSMMQNQLDLQIMGLWGRFRADIGNRCSGGSKHLLLTPAAGLNTWQPETNYVY